MDGKKKRGSNYTAAEKEFLLKIIKKYVAVIENKETKAHMILKKRQAWNSVCQQYNAVAVSGRRTWQQLRHLYENIKQRSKKNIARVNKEINRTVGGHYNSTLTEQDNQIFATVAPQVQPLSNPYDDAAVYFGDIEENIRKSNSETPTELKINTNNIDDQHTNIPNTNIDSNKPCTDTSINTIKNEMHDAIVVKVEPEDATVTINPEPTISPTNTTGKLKNKEKRSIKQQYFKTKLKNAKLETKYLINKNRMKVNKYKLEMHILKLRLNKLKSKN